MCPPPCILILFSTHCWVTSRSSSLRRSILCAHSGPDFLNTGNYACQLVFPLSGSFHLNPFWRGLFSAHLLRKMQMFSPHYFCAYTISVSEPAAAVHRSANRALAHTLPAVFRTLVPWTLQCSRNGSCDWAASGLQFSLDSEAILCREVRWWRCSKASRNAASSTSSV